MRTLKNKTLMQITMIFIYIPIILWLFMWCNIFIALIATAVSVYGFYQFTKDITGEMEYSLPILIFLTVIILVIFIKCGYCGIFNQHYDWYKTNAVMSDLVNYDSPVYYETVTENGTEQAMLTYYLGIYMFPSLMGKMLGENICCYFLLFQQMITVILIYLNLCKCLKAKKIVQMLFIAFIMTFFDFPMIFACIVQKTLQILGYTPAFATEVSTWAVATYPFNIWDSNSNLIDPLYIYKDDPTMILEFRGLEAGQMAFVPYYIIMLVTTVWYDNKDKLKSYMFIWIPMALYCCLAIPYILIIVAGVFIYQIIKTDKKIPIIRDNLISLISVIPVFIYLAGNIFGKKENSYNGLTFANINLFTVLYPLVCVLPFFIVAYKSNKNDKIYYATGILMFISCFLSFGRYNDLMITGTIPLTTMLIIFVSKNEMQNIEKGFHNLLKTEKISKFVLLILLLIPLATNFTYLKEWDIKEKLNSNIYSYDYNLLSEIEDIDLKETRYYDLDTILYNTRIGSTYGTMGQFANRYGKYEDDLKYNYFTYDYPDSLFYKFFARK